MIILGIETSCDETAAAIIKDGQEILSNVVASSADMHKKTGGIIPEQAARQQIKSIIPVIDDAIKISKRNPKTLDGIAVTVGPGLIGSLLVGVETAKTLSYIWKKPIIPVNHLVGHFYANWLTSNNEDKHNAPEFPAVGLLVSGGHTDLIIIKNHGKFKWLGGTRDDAAGEAFDKTARLLGLPYPGGPEISKEAQKYLDNNSKKPDIFPRPMINDETYDFSFSGLKTAVLNKVQGMKNVENNISFIAANVQEAIADVLVEKTVRAVKEFRPKSLLVAGGVAANLRLREKFQSAISGQPLKVGFRVPPPNLCTDNATYIASCAYFNNSPISWKKVQANPELTIVGQS
jgi:N6-L-threonylcarbamoyladenine synthase